MLSPFMHLEKAYKSLYKALISIAILTTILILGL